MSFSTKLFEHIASRILAAHGNPTADLRGSTVLLPDLHVAQPLAQALLRVSQQPALLLPQMVTLNQWAQSVTVGVPALGDRQRCAMLYQLLRDKKWFEQADLWGIAQELLQLFDELSTTLHTLPRDEDSFVAAVQQAYEARQNTVLQLEARLVFELWYAMQSGTERDSATVYQLRLARLAQQAGQPLFVLRTSDWNSLEQRFLEQYAERAEVTVFDLREMPDVEQGLLAAALMQSGGQGIALRDSAQKLQLQNIPALGDTLRLFAASSLEQHARAAAMQVRLWLQQGKRNIAIVAQDRVVARRTRALLERAEVLVRDESGWTFATLSVSTVLDRWLAVLQSDFYHHDLLDLLKSPYIFAEQESAGRKALVYQLEQLQRQQNVVSGLDSFIVLTVAESGLHQALLRLQQAAAVFNQKQKKSLSQWLAALQQSLQVLGITPGLQGDDAGAQLLLALQDWQQELAQAQGLYHFNEWRRWLAYQLDAQTYQDRSIASPVCFTHLAATRWRCFDAVLLLGCDAEHLPSVADGGRWFNDAVRSSLGLSTRESRAAQQRDNLLALLTLNDRVLATWQNERDGEAQLLSPYLELLRDLHQCAYADDLMDTQLQGYLDAEDERTVRLPIAAQPAPGVPAHSLPERVSISAYNSLVACPYQFYARHILRLNELDEVQEAIEKSDYGERVHEILQRFHQRYPLLAVEAREGLERDLQQISHTVFGELLQHDFAARAWLARWYQSLPAYLDWQIEIEQQGWRYQQAEIKFDIALDAVRLRGRADRLDANGTENCVLDYKTQHEQVLRDKLREPGEDVQLACYAYAFEATDAAFLSIENGKVKRISAKEDMAQLAQLNAARLEAIMAALRSGAALPANGVDAVCQYCEMRGVCRKGEWTAAEVGHG